MELDENGIRKGVAIQKITNLGKTKAAIRYGQELIRFMEEYGLKNLKSATLDQIMEYLKKNDPKFDSEKFEEKVQIRIKRYEEYCKNKKEGLSSGKIKSNKGTKFNDEDKVR